MSSIATHKDPGRPQMSHNSKSFSRIEPTRSSPLRSRANTLSHGVVPAQDNPLSPEAMGDVNSKLQHEDVFEKNSPNGTSTVNSDQPLSPQEIPEGFDDLPIELVSLIDRFLESLTVKAHNTPPTIDKISDRFQEFYKLAESHIATHISILSTRQNRESSPTPSIASKRASSFKEGNRIRTSSSGDSLAPLAGSVPEQQMLTPQEIYDRRKARRLLEHKRVALEEAVERRVCERMYKRVWRHRSTLDEVRDEKLRSRTAALALVGIGLPDLGVTFDKLSSNGENPASPDAEIEAWISKAREGLLKMNDARHPLGKLQHLTATHKCIVDLLTDLHQSSSSADEILPTLIYTLITTPTEGINVISNLHFAQRFRNTNKIDGEAAYCLTNLEAAISFLETVDLATLRSDETLEGPPKSSSRPSTPRTEQFTEWNPDSPRLESKSSLDSFPATAASINVTQPVPSPPRSPPNRRPAAPGSPEHKRRVSDLFQPSASAFGAAGDAVRSTADQGFRNISSTLDNSFKFLFGRLKERQESIDATATGEVILPRTLDDARRLVEPKPIEEDEGPASGASSVTEHQLDGPTEDSIKPLVSSSEEKLFGLIAGRKENRDRSVDSNQSSGSGKRVAFAASFGSGNSASHKQPIAESPATSSPIESMRNLGNSLNPLKGFTGMGGLRAFGRSASSTSNPAVSSAGNAEKAPNKTQDPDSAETKLTVDSSVAPKRKLEPPVRKFLSLRDANELRIGDIEELLKDYKRLANELRDLGVFGS